MTRLRRHDFSVSLAGLGAGPDQSEEHPLGVGGDRRHDRAFGDATEVDLHSVTDGTEAALERASAAAGGRDVRLGGGVSTVQQYLRAGLPDEVHVVVVPVLLGSGERLFDGPTPRGWRCVEFTPSRTVAHVRLRRDA